MKSQISAQKSIIIRLNFSKQIDHNDDANPPVLIRNCKRKIDDLYMNNQKQQQQHEEHEEEQVKEKEESDLEVAEVDRVNPSYVLLPPPDKKSVESMTAKLGDSDNSDFDPREVLNTVCKLSPPKQEDRPKKLEASAQREERMEREHELEDQMYEIDMLMRTLESTIQVVKNHIDFSLIKDRCSDVVVVIDKEDYFKSRHFRCIEHLYDDHGLDVINLLRTRPMVVLPVLMKRLVEKRDELHKFRRALFKSENCRAQVCYGE